MKQTFISLILAIIVAIIPVYELYSQEQELNLIQNIEAREKLTFDGTWKIIVDPLENGYYNHRYLPHKEGESTKALDYLQ